MTPKITIIGAGLTGLTLAYLLKKEGVDCTLLEARDRLGGRIFTKMSGNHIPIDLGAAWFWDYNPLLKKLLEQLNITYFPQEIGQHVWYQPNPKAKFLKTEIPAAQQTSYRMKGGTTNLVLSLASHLDQEQILLEHEVRQITYKYSKFRIETSAQVIHTDLVINTLPPAITVQLKFEPVLPKSYVGIAGKTHTWMQDSIKFGIGFPKAYWKEKQIPLTAFSRFAVISEMYDYSSEEQDRFAVMGFLNDSYSQLTAQTREQQVMEIVISLIGKDAIEHVSYEECVWSKQPFTKVQNTAILRPHQYNGHEILRSRFCDDRLIMAGSETSTAHPGYMEGAVQSAYRVFDYLMS
jgi:monoamine oxidase